MTAPSSLPFLSEPRPRKGIPKFVTQFQAIYDHIPPALLVIFRIGGLMVYAPMLGSSVIPARIKVFLAVCIGLAVYPILAGGDLMVVPLKLDLWLLAPMIALELLIGMAIGFIASIPLIGIQTGGLLMGQQMGLGFARFFNPAIGDEADVIGQILFFMGLATFLLIGGHEAMLIAVLDSFHYVKLGGFVPDESVIMLITGLLLSSFELAMRLAAPVLAVIFLQSVAMGFLAKTVPQLNILSLGFPIRILTGIAMIATGLVVLDSIIMDELNDGITVMFQWIDSGLKSQGLH